MNNFGQGTHISGKALIDLALQFDGGINLLSTTTMKRIASQLQVEPETVQRLLQRSECRPYIHTHKKISNQNLGCLAILKDLL